jgi:hypothetical protein
MPTLTVTKNWDDGQVLTEAQLDDIKNSLETFFNTTKINSANIQDGGVSTANLADLAVTVAKIANSTITGAKIASNVALAGTPTAATGLSINPAAAGSAGSDLTLLTMTAGTAVGTARQKWLNSTSTRSFEFDADFTSGSEGLFIQSDTNTIASFTRAGNTKFLGTVQVGGASGPTLSFTSSALASNNGTFYPGTSAGAALEGYYSDRTLGIRTKNTATILPIVTSASPATHALTIVRGEVSAAGAKVTGEGFTCAKNSTGNYTVTFSSAFATAPIMTLSLMSATSALDIGFNGGTAPTTTSAGILTTSGGSLSDQAFHFIAIGERGA